MKRNRLNVCVGGAIAASIFMAGCDMNPSEPILDGNIKDAPISAPDHDGPPPPKAESEITEDSVQPETNDEVSENE